MKYHLIDDGPPDKRKSAWRTIVEAGIALIGVVGIFILAFAIARSGWFGP